ncbi:MAG: serine/threonine protein kinase [Kiritimatiellia bacterium]|jgi:serine/threonine protein kinase
MSDRGRRYRILETLGRGGFGTVYRAELIAAGGFSKEVAVKVLNDNANEGDDVLLRLRDEARILGLLKHRAIVGVDDLAHLAEGWAIVMEYVAGADLAQLIVGNPPPPRAAAEIIEEIASALHMAYSVPNRMTGKPLALIHRDIKPPNIRLTALGEVKVLDFGVARAEFGARESRTESMAYGSVAYMAPERLIGMETHQGDIFALGMVALQCFSGKQAEIPTKLPKSFGPWVDDHIEAIRARCLAAPSEAMDRLEALLREMVQLDYTERCNARRVEQVMRDVGALLPGSKLRDWAERAVSSVGAKPVTDPMTGTILVERSGAVELVRPEDDFRASHNVVGTSSGTNDASASVSLALPLRNKGALAAVAALGIAGAAALLTLVVVVGLGVAWSNMSTQAPVAAQETPEEILVEEVAIEDMTQPPPAEAPPEELPSPTEVAAPAVAVHAPKATPKVSRTPRFSPEPVPAAPPEPVEEPPEAPARPTPGFVVVSGADTWHLKGAAGKVPPGPTPPGTYDVLVDFGSGPMTAATVDVASGETVRLSCNQLMMRCAAR